MARQHTTNDNGKVRERLLLHAVSEEVQRLAAFLILACTTLRTSRHLLIALHLMACRRIA